MMYYYYSPFHFLFSIISWILVIAIILWLLRGSRHDRWMKRGRHMFYDPAMDTLRERYAKGEISKEEYEERKKALEHND